MPHLSQLSFVVSNDAKKTAWELFIEVATRVSTQPLGPEEGFAREALTSLYQLFTRTRELLARCQPTPRVTGGKTVECLALTMLNRQLRPFLGRWHPQLTRFEKGGADEQTWEDNEAFRTELERLRHDLITYALGFAELAGIQDAHDLIDAQPSEPQAAGS